MATRRGAVIAGVRGLAGLVVLIVVGIAMIVAVTISLPHASLAVPAETVAPTPSARQRVCPGPLLALAADSTKATVASAFGSTSITSAAESGAPGPRATDVIPADKASASIYGTASVLTVPAAAASALPSIAGSQSQTAARDDMAGLAVASCTEASGDSWLVAGSTTLGETSLIMLTNPTDVVATVDLTVYGASGAINAPGASGITIQPGTQHVVALAGIAPNEAAPVVHVVSQGGTVSASVQQSLVRGLDPGGVELVSPTAPPATRQVITGVSVTDLAALKAANASDGYAEALPALRVLVPGKKDAQVSVGAVNESGKPAGATAEVTVKAGVATEIPLAGLTDGNYTLTVSSDQPAVAAARTSTVSADAHDFSWFTASTPFTGTFLASVADGPNPVLHLMNNQSADATLTLTPAHGAAQAVTIAAGSATNVAVRAGGTYTVTGGTALRASLSYSASGEASAFALNAPGPAASPITVYMR